MEVKDAANAAFSVVHPEIPEISGVYGAIISGAPRHPGSTQANACVFADGELDRSPTGSGTAGRIAQLHARGLFRPGETLVNESIIGSVFRGRILQEAEVAGRPAVIPEIQGDAFICGFGNWLIDERDPLSYGFQLTGARALSQWCPALVVSRSPASYDWRTGARRAFARLVSPPVALALDVFARSLAEIGRADDEDLEALRPGLVASPRTGRDAHRVPFLELDDLVVELHPPAPAQDHVHLLLLLVRVAVRKAIAGRDALVAQAGLLELERLGRQAELQVRRAVEPGPDVLQVLLEVPERERHGAILWHLWLARLAILPG